MAQICDQVVDALTVYLKTVMQDEIDDEDPTRVKLVHAGRLQSDPTKPTTYTHLLVHTGDPSDTSYAHEIASGAALRSVGLTAAQRQDEQSMAPEWRPWEIGGGSQWLRRFTVDVNCYFVNQPYPRDVARQHAHVVLGRCEHAIQTCTSILGLTDEFGETSVQAYVVKSQMSEGGGPSQSFIWRGHVWFAVLTQKAD